MLLHQKSKKLQLLLLQKIQAEGDQELVFAVPSWESLCAAEHCGSAGGRARALRLSPEVPVARLAVPGVPAASPAARGIPRELLPPLPARPVRLGWAGVLWSLRGEIRTQLVEQFKCLEQQSESRLQLLQDLQEFFRRKAEIELEYSRSLEKLAERFSSKIRSSREHQFKKDQHLLSPVNCWYLVLTQTRRESRDHATLNDIFMNNVIVRLSQISEDVIRLFKKSKEIGLQMHEELLKVTNELYTVMKTYHMYHAESISAESKLKEAEKQEEKQFNKSGDISVNLLRHEDRPQRRSSVKKIEKMKEKRQAKYSENKLKCTKARNDYLLNLAATNAAVSKYYIHDVSDLID
ncbi:SLIT-ROBO Rho GTPase-activating protein 3-like, partial [Antrostomus carolinensis]|uniref:SLIT-ROBO Rho GTPase-activating protein 3-like n=1 Tax=Antrostomus carolinensis TaxID=279965 RepID=UPI000529126F